LPRFLLLNALVGHVPRVTVNDYLAKRDASGLADLRVLGLTVGVIVHDLDDGERPPPTPATFTTAPITNSARLLRDNMKFE